MIPEVMQGFGYQAWIGDTELVKGYFHLVSKNLGIVCSPFEASSAPRQEMQVQCYLPNTLYTKLIY